MKYPKQFAPSLSAGVLVGALVLTQAAVAQNPGMQAAQQASQQAIQQANQQAIQQANQQAIQQANQQAILANQQAMQNASQSSSAGAWPLTVNHPPAPQVPGGPLPARIASAHNVLLTNVGATPRLGLDGNQLYNDIRQRMEQWGYYQLVSTPQQADLIFQFDVVDPRTGLNVTPGTDLYNRTPMFRIVILDAQSSVPLWTVTAPIYITGKKTYAHWMDVSEEGLLTRLKALAQQPISPEEQAALTQYPPTHRTRTLVLAIGIPTAVAVGAVVGMHVASDNSLNSMKASQDAFCEQHNIPLSECAGG